MSPIQPTVVRVSPRCSRCGAGGVTLSDGRYSLIRGDGPPICRHCLVECVRLGEDESWRVAMNGLRVASHDDDQREGQWP